MKKKLFLAIFLVLCFFISADAGTIKTNISCRYKIENSDTINMMVKVSNTGDDTAYDLKATIILDEHKLQHNELGDNAPGKKINFKSRISITDLKPGKYFAVIIINFKEQNGVLHRAYHFFQIPYNIDKTKNYKSKFTANISKLVFNKKAFWHKKDNIQLVIKNNYNKVIKPKAYFYPSEGFTCQEYTTYNLIPGQEKKDIISVIKDQSVNNNGMFYVVVHYEHEEKHYSHLIKSTVKIADKPIYFKLYLIIGAMLLLIVIVIIIRKHSERNDP
ncbi:putative CARDB domain-containing protein [Candidatus Magnetomoraceae bacterium gMMP-1]